MTESAMASLRRLLVAEYGSLKQRLARRFGSADFAGEVLHEAWLRLDRMEGAAPGAIVQNPIAYLYRVALNVAADQQRQERRLARPQIEAIIQNAVEELDPSRVAEARFELNRLASALEALPPRQRAVFVASRLEGLPHKQIAARLGITVRVVDRDLKIALDHFAALLEKKSVPRRGPRPAEPS